MVGKMVGRKREKEKQVFFRRKSSKMEYGKKLAMVAVCD